MTTDLVFVDTNVFLYARDDRFPNKQRPATHTLAAREALVVSPPVLGEIDNAVLRGKVAVDSAAMRQPALELQPLSQGATDLELITRAWSIRTETIVQWWACIIFAAARRAGCRYLLPEDYQHGRTVRGTTILNPFMVGPEAVVTEH